MPRARISLFAAPPDRDLDWQEDGVAGVSRFLARVWRLTTKYAPVACTGRGQTAEAPTGLSLKLLRKLHQTIAKITLDFEGRWHFNTDVAAIMELVNELQAADAQLAGGDVPPGNAGIAAYPGAVARAVCAAPGCRTVGGTGRREFRPSRTLADSDPELAKDDELGVPVQINGKLVTVIGVPADADAKMLQAAALADEKVEGRIAGKTVVKIIVVPRKLVNLVVR